MAARPRPPKRSKGRPFAPGHGKVGPAGSPRPAIAPPPSMGPPPGMGLPPGMGDLDGDEGYASGAGPELSPSRPGSARGGLGAGRRRIARRSDTGGGY